MTTMYEKEEKTFPVWLYVTQEKLKMEEGTMLKKVGILANGGDVSGFNAVIRAIVKTAENHGVECYGIVDGYNGLLKKDFEKLSTAANGEAVGILPKGGSIIGSSTNANIFNYKIVNEDGSVEYKDLSEQAIENIKEFGFDCIFTLGGDGTQKSARDFSTKGVNIIGVPKTIDNDVACTEITFGYNTAVSVAMEALDRLHTTGETHHRIMVLEVMGRYAGWIALESAIAGGADVALIPEIPYDIEKVYKAIDKRTKDNKGFTIVAVAEGALPKEVAELPKKKRKEVIANNPYPSVAYELADKLKAYTTQDIRIAIPGHTQRGGSPDAYDRVISSRFGAKAAELIKAKDFGKLVVFLDNKVTAIPLSESAGKLKYVSPDDDIVSEARTLGISFGDK